jgi:pimeloyl-ACP methyl ester carboxylesterase
MKYQRHRTRITAFLLMVLLAAPAMWSGCGQARPGRVDYIVKQGGREGTVVGSQVVRWSDKGRLEAYATVERRPYQVYDTTVYRNLTVSARGRSLEGYYSNVQVPGASYRTYLKSENGGYSYLANDLQTFSYVPDVTSSGGLLPFESDSACLMQALADKFFAAKTQEATTVVLVPSRSSVVRQIVIKQEGQNGLKVTGEGISAVEMKFDGAGVLTEAEGAGMFIERGHAGNLASRPFKPRSASQEIVEVRVQTPDRVSSGERLELAGSLYVPSGKKPYKAVVLAGEFGPQDRTGGGFLSQLADRLVNRGMAVLVCDRRGVPQSQGSYATYTLDSYASDLNAEVDYLVLRSDIDVERISMIGYGEGGIAASKVAASNPYVSSLVLMAAPFVPLFPDLRLMQVNQAAQAGMILPAEAEAAELNINNLTRLLEQQSAATITIDNHPLFLNWMRSQEAGDLPGWLGALEIPVLVVQGSADERVPAGQAQQIMRSLEARGGGTQELSMFEGLGHDFGPFVSQGESVPYRAHPRVDRSVLDKVANWLEGM